MFHNTNNKQAEVFFMTDDFDKKVQLIEEEKMTAVRRRSRQFRIFCRRWRIVWLQSRSNSSWKSK